MTRIWFYFLQDYGKVLDELTCGDTLGVLVTTEGELHFTINEVDQGIAWDTLPTDRPLYVVINLTKDAQISTVDRSAMRIMSKYHNDPIMNISSISSVHTHRIIPRFSWRALKALQKVWKSHDLQWCNHCKLNIHIRLTNDLRHNTMM